MTEDDPRVIVIPETTAIMPAPPSKPILREAALPVAGAAGVAATLLWVGTKVAKIALAHYKRKMLADAANVETQRHGPLPDANPITIEPPERQPQRLDKPEETRPQQASSRRMIYRASWSLTVIRDDD